LALARGVGLRLFAAQLAAATLLVDGDSALFVNEWPPVRAELARDTADRRAGWMLRLVEAAGAGDTDPLPPSVSPIFDPNAPPPAAGARSNVGAAYDRVPHARPGASDPRGRERAGRPAVGQEPRAARLPRAFPPGNAEPRAPHRPLVGRQAAVQGTPFAQHRAEPAAGLRGR